MSDETLFGFRRRRRNRVLDSAARGILELAARTIRAGPGEWRPGPETASWYPEPEMGCPIPWEEIVRLAPSLGDVPRGTSASDDKVRLAARGVVNHLMRLRTPSLMRLGSIHAACILELTVWDDPRSYKRAGRRGLKMLARAWKRDGEERWQAFIAGYFGRWASYCHSHHKHLPVTYVRELDRRYPHWRHEMSHLNGPHPVGALRTALYESSLDDSECFVCRSQLSQGSQVVPPWAVHRSLDLEGMAVDAVLPFERDRSERTRCLLLGQLRQHLKKQPVVCLCRECFARTPFCTPGAH